VRLILGLERRPEPDDAADALALAICHVNSQHFRQRVAAAR
jgi:crossover junction endodeoxyribonuclease RuvC